MTKITLYQYNGKKDTIGEMKNGLVISSQALFTPLNEFLAELVVYFDNSDNAKNYNYIEIDKNIDNKNYKNYYFVEDLFILNDNKAKYMLSLDIVRDYLTTNNNFHITAVTDNGIGDIFFENTESVYIPQDYEEIFNNKNVNLGTFKNLTFNENITDINEWTSYYEIGDFVTSKKDLIYFSDIFNAYLVVCNDLLGEREINTEVDSKNKEQFIAYNIEEDKYKTLNWCSGKEKEYLLNHQVNGKYYYLFIDFKNANLEGKEPNWNTEFTPVKFKGKFMDYPIKIQTVDGGDLDGQYREYNFWCGYKYPENLGAVRINHLNEMISRLSNYSITSGVGKVEKIYKISIGNFINKYIDSVLVEEQFNEETLQYEETVIERDTSISPALDNFRGTTVCFGTCHNDMYLGIYENATSYYKSNFAIRKYIYDFENGIIGLLLKDDILEINMYDEYGGYKETEINYQRATPIFKYKDIEVELHPKRDKLYKRFLYLGSELKEKIVIEHTDIEGNKTYKEYWTNFFPEVALSRNAGSIDKEYYDKQYTLQKSKLNSEIDIELEQRANTIKDKKVDTAISIGSTLIQGTVGAITGNPYGIAQAVGTVSSGVSSILEIERTKRNNELRDKQIDNERLYIEEQHKLEKNKRERQGAIVKGGDIIPDISYLYPCLYYSRLKKRYKKQLFNLKEPHVEYTDIRILLASCTNFKGYVEKDATKSERYMNELNSILLNGVYSEL